MQTSVQPSSSVMAELALANLPPEEQQGQEEIELVMSELPDGEELAQQQMGKGKQGVLNTPTGRYYNFTPKKAETQAQTLASLISDPHKADIKSSEPKLYNLSKEGTSPTSKNPLEGKRFSQHTSLSKTAKQTQGQQPAEGGKGPAVKTAYVAKQQLAQPPKTRSQTSQKRPQQKGKKETQERRETQSSQSKAAHGKQSQQAVKEQQRCEHDYVQEQREKEGEKERREEDQEGFAEQQQQQEQQRPEDQEKDRVTACGAKKPLKAQIEEYGKQDSILSEVLGVRANQFDVMIIFFELMKVLLKSREQQLISRREERDLQLAHMEKVVKNYKSQARAMLFTGIGAGVMGIVSGLTPIVGHMKGDWMIDKLSGVFSSFDGMKKKQFTESIMKMTMAMSEMQKNVGEIQKTKHEGTRTFDQSMSDLYRADWDETTRTMEELKDHWKSIENFLHQSLQMYHDTNRQLYS